MRNVTLILNDGSRFSGKSFGYEKPVAGEVVFNTAMTGYPESLTDPSYAGQLM
ncbi:MAG: carbamoyl-phosphate synthase (glutamine-hydrolyzing) small subunit, partial [Bacteroides sp.]|nr:carbamoyl-phosphate synthase (glutamine-hydrolyzing) small subunit [Bacteroides sp.]